MVASSLGQQHDRHWHDGRTAELVIGSGSTQAHTALGTRGKKLVFPAITGERVSRQFLIFTGVAGQRAEATIIISVRSHHHCGLPEGTHFIARYRRYIELNRAGHTRQAVLPVCGL